MIADDNILKTLDAQLRTCYDKNNAQALFYKIKDNIGNHNKTEEKFINELIQSSQFDKPEYKEKIGKIRKYLLDNYSKIKESFEKEEEEKIHTLSRQPKLLRKKKVEEKKEEK